MRKEFGWVGSDPEEVALVAERVEVPDVVICYGDQALPAHEVTLSDLSVGEVQPAVELESDAKGAIGTEWLEGGRRYFVMVHGPLVPSGELVGGAITWSGQKKLDMREVAARYREEIGAAPR